METALDSLRNPVILVAIAAASFLGASILCLLFLWIARLSQGQNATHATVAEALAVGVPFSVLGVAVGYLTGISREAAVGSVVPAVLTLLGALTLYIGSNGGRKSMLASATMIYVTIALVTGVGYGSRLRVAADEFEKSPRRLISQAHDEANLKHYRQAIGLDDDPKSFAAQAEAADVELHIRQYRRLIGLDH